MSLFLCVGVFITKNAPFVQEQNAVLTPETGYSIILCPLRCQGRVSLAITWLRFRNEGKESFEGFRSVFRFLLSAPPLNNVRGSVWKNSHSKQTAISAPGPQDKRADIMEGCNYSLLPTRPHGVPGES